MPIPSVNNEQTIELFCGEEKTFSLLVGSLGYKTFTVDRDPAVSPDLVADIREMVPTQVPAQPLLLWSRPPCRSFTGTGAWKNDQPATPDAERSLELLGRAITLMSRVQPTWWFVETPKSPLRKNSLMAGFNRGYPSRTRQTIKHEEYGGASGLETDVWTNAFWWLPRGGSPSSTEARQARGLPPFAIAEMLDQLDAYQRAKVNG